jgi:hypothetical protein
MQGSIQPTLMEIDGSLLVDEILPAGLQISQPILIPLH